MIIIKKLDYIAKLETMIHHSIIKCKDIETIDNVLKQIL